MSPTSSPAMSLATFPLMFLTMSVFATLALFCCYAISGEVSGELHLLFYFLSEPFFASVICCRGNFLLPEMFFCYMQI
jgi:hypothetical protein